ncbi:hypothetical protein BOX15_Mlig017429g4, partial [Macrostomum lignano]
KISLRQCIELASCVFAIFSIPYMCLLQLLHILPHYHNTSEPVYWLHVIAGVFLLINVCANFYKLYSIDASMRGRLVESSEIGPAWRFCHACECHCPPRSYHCDVCNICVLKRDHHCLFAVNCVGLANQRYYLLTVVYFAIAAIYAAVFNWRFVLDAHEGLSLKSAFQLTVPFMSMMFGVSSLYQFCLAITQIICIFGGGLLWLLFGLHLRLLLVNQTVHERAKMICDYNMGWRQNVMQVFGPRYLLAFVWPFTVSRLPLDGFKFPIAGGGEAPRKTL